MVDYKVKEILDLGDKIEVRILHPNLIVECWKFNKSEDWFEEVDYEKEGKELKDPRWKIHIEKILEERENQKKIKIDLHKFDKYINKPLNIKRTKI